MKTNTAKKVLAGSMAIAMLTSNVADAGASALTEQEALNLENQSEVEAAQENTPVEEQQTQTEEVVVEEVEVEASEPQEETVKEEQPEQEEAPVEVEETKEAVVEEAVTTETPETTVETIEDVVVVEGVAGKEALEKDVKATAQTASNYDELKAILATKPSNITITLTGNIIVPEGERLEIVGQSQNVVIDGDNQYSINLGETSNVNNKFYVRGKGTVIKNLTITGYKSSAMYVFSTATDVRVENVTLNGNGATIGIDLVGAKVTLKGIKSHKHSNSGIRLRSKAEVIYEGGNEHTDDFKPLVIIDQNGASGGTVDSSSAPAGEKQYTQIDKYTNPANGAVNHYYALAYMVEVGSHDELEKALKNPNTYITLKNDITLQGNVDIDKEATFIIGKGFSIHSNGHKLSVKNTQNVSIEDVNFREYKENALIIWNTQNVKIKEVGFLGNLKDNPVKSLVGLDIYGSTVELSDIYTRNHEYRAVSVRNGSEVTLSGTNVHYGDKVDIQMLYGDAANGTASVIKDNADYYDKTDVITSNGVNTVKYYGATRKDTPEVEDGLVIDILKGSTYDAMDWIEATDKQDGIDKEITNLKITLVSDGIKIDEIGQYEVVYEVEDYDGNKTTVKRVINVFEPTNLPSDDLVEDFTFVDKVVEGVLSKDNATDEEKVEQFKELLKGEGMSDAEADGTSDEIYKEVLDYIKGDIDNLTGNYSSFEDVKQLIEDVKNTYTNVTLPDDSFAEDFSFMEKVEDIVTNDTYTDEEKIDKFKEALTEDGETNVDDTSDEIYKEVLDHIKNDTENGTGNYATSEDVKQLIEDIKNTYTNVTLPDDAPVGSFTFIEKLEGILKDENTTDEEKLDKFKELLEEEGLDADILDGTSNEIFKEVLDYIKGDIENGTGNYSELEDVEQLIEDIKKTHTNVTLPDDNGNIDTDNPFNDGDNVEDDMEVDPDKDQIVDDKPTTLPDDNGNVDLDNPFNDGDNVEDDMEVDPDKDQVVEDEPTTLPDDSFVGEFSFMEKVEDILADKNTSDEEKFDKFKDVLAEEVGGIDDASDEILKEALDYIKNDIENGTGEYEDAEDVKQLIQDIKDTKTEVTLPDDIYTEDFTFVEKVEELLKDTTTTDEEKLDKFKDALVEDGETDVDNVSDDIYKEVLDHIKNDIENGTGNYATSEDIKQLIEDVKNTKTEVTLPDDNGNIDTDNPFNDGDNVEDDMEVDNSQFPSLPPVDEDDNVEDDMEVDTDKLPSAPMPDEDDNVNDDMEVDTDKLPSKPQDDEDDMVEDDMEVNPDELPSKPQEDEDDMVEDDMEVDTDKIPSLPNYDVEDDMEVDTDKIPSLPNYGDVEDDMEVDTNLIPSLPNYDVEDDMMVDTGLIPSLPNYDVEDDMMVDTDKIPSKPNYDVEDDMMVDTDKLPSVPNYDVEDDMMVNPDMIPSIPNYDTDDEMGVNPDLIPDVPNYDVDDDMMVNPDEDQVVENTPVTLPDDVPVKEDSTVEPKPETKPETTPGTDKEESGSVSKPGTDKEESGSVSKPGTDKEESGSVSKPGTNKEETGSVSKPGTDSFVGNNPSGEDKEESGGSLVAGNPSTGLGKEESTTNAPNNNSNNNANTETGVGTGSIVTEKNECNCGSAEENYCKENKIFPWLLLGWAAGMLTTAFAWFMIAFLKRKKDKEEETK